MYRALVCCFCSYGYSNMFRSGPHSPDDPPGIDGLAPFLFDEGYNESLLQPPLRPPHAHPLPPTQRNDGS